MLGEAIHLTELLGDGSFDGKLYGKTRGNPNEFHGKLGSSMDIFL
jgi:hypothetical protein